MRSPFGIQWSRPDPSRLLHVREILLFSRHVGRPVDNCPHCDGTGWEPGPDEWETINGEPHRYTTVIPCRHTRRTSREWTGPDA